MTRLEGLVLITPAKHGDDRGFFMETYRADAWAAHVGIEWPEGELTCSERDGNVPRLAEIADSLPF